MTTALGLASMPISSIPVFGLIAWVHVPLYNAPETTLDVQPAFGGRSHWGAIL